MILTSFSPVITDNAKILILGSMPGSESLRQQQYYAHGRNAFWFIMGKIFNAGPSLCYPMRVQQLQVAGVAIWDVLKHCIREGSLDSNIQVHTEKPNDIISLLQQHQSIRYVFFNGQKPAAAFRKHILNHLMPELKKRLVFEVLPSTSPANARLSQAQKLAIWKQKIVPLTLDIRESQPDLEEAARNVSRRAFESIRKIYHPTPETCGRQPVGATNETRLIACIAGHVSGTVLYDIESSQVIISGLAVDREFRQLGIARRLLNHVIQKVSNQGYSSIFLKTIKETGNVEIFQRIGFTVVEEAITKDFISNRFDPLHEVTMKFSS